MKLPFFSREKKANPTTPTCKPMFFIEKDATKEAAADTTSAGGGPLIFDVKEKWPSELGVAHPFDMKTAEGIYTKFGFITGAINKYVDYMVSKFYVTAEKDTTEKIIEDWMRDVDFRTLLKPFAKEALVKGNSYMYLKDIKKPKILDAKYIWIDRDKHGEIQGYNQYIGTANNYDIKKVIPMKKEDIAHLAFNKIGDNAYGLGLVYPATPLINDFLCAQKEMHTLMKRKANAPILIKMGYLSGETMIIPTGDAVADLTSTLSYLNNRTEWAYTADMEISTLNFGNIGEKFNFILEHDAKMLFFSLEVPEVLMGSGDIAEGLGTAQSEMWKLNIASKQADVEKVIEQNIFKKVLSTHGIDEHVEFHWGEPSDKEKLDKIDRIKNILTLPNLSIEFQVELEKQLAKLLGISEDVVDSEEEKQKAMMDRQQPFVPGQDGGKMMPNVPGASKGMGLRGKPQKRPENPPAEDSDEEECWTGMVTEKDHALAEWIGFNYEQYKQEIIEFLRKDPFDNLAATTALDIEMGYFTMEQINALRTVLVEGFQAGSSIRTIAGNIQKVVQPGALYQKVGDTMTTVVSADWRSILIARTETVRAANEGSLLHYEANGVQEYRWIASTGKRTCPECQELNGKVYTIGEGPTPPLHPACRCAVGAVVKI